VDRAIPIPRELVPGDAIPPICVEAPIRKVGEFGQKVQDTLPDYIPSLQYVSNRV